MLTLSDLVANRTMSPEMATTLAVAAQERRSLLFVAIPRMAGKTTVMNATLQYVPDDTPLHPLSRAYGATLGIPDYSADSYLVVPEISPAGEGLVFAHAQGIVHRDLKPGNVWLTAEGVAKIGDFGLAVNLGRSRLTQHGLMVGTVAYMPPEQALGGEPTAQSDLYSLGAMLYELVTGKPPFQADDPTAVISQHINTPPVAPSYRSEHCPPDLTTRSIRVYVPDT